MALLIDIQRIIFKIIFKKIFVYKAKWFGH